MAKPYPCFHPSRRYQSAVSLTLSLRHESWFLLPFLCTLVCARLICLPLRLSNDRSFLVRCSLLAFLESWMCIEGASDIVLSRTRLSLCLWKVRFSRAGCRWHPSGRTLLSCSSAPCACSLLLGAFRLRLEHIVCFFHSLKPFLRAARLVRMRNTLEIFVGPCNLFFGSTVVEL